MNNNSIGKLPLSQQIEIWEEMGYGYEASAEIELSGGGLSYSIFQTGNRPVILYSRRVSFNGIGFNAIVNRDPIFTGGIQSEIYQSSDMLTNDPESSILTGATITDQGVLTRAPIPVFGNTSNQGNGGTLELVDRPQLVLPNKKLLLIFENRDDAKTQDIGVVLQWVEPTEMPNIIIQNGQAVGYNGVK